MGPDVEHQQAAVGEVSGLVIRTRRGEPRQLTIRPNRPLAPQPRIRYYDR